MTNTTISREAIDRKATALIEAISDAPNIATYTLREKLEIVVALATIAGNDSARAFALGALAGIYGEAARDASTTEEAIAARRKYDRALDDAAEIGQHEAAQDIAHGYLA